MSAEPISVRIARLRGCEPKHWQEGPGVGVIGPFWQCPDGEHETPGAYFGQIDYLTPAASFVLLSELIGWGCSVEFLPVAVGTVTNEEFIRVRVMLPVEINAEWKRLTVSRPPSRISEAIAEVWVATATAKAAS